jgi:hypothetical protein
MIYKVIFKGNEETEGNELALTFESGDFNKPLKIPTDFFFELKKLSETSNNVIDFKNIEEVIEIGQSNSGSSYNYHLVLLFTNKSSQVKEGYLIGNVKKLGDILIGVFPFNKNISDLTPELFSEKISNLITNPHEYSEICLIAQS